MKVIIDTSILVELDRGNKEVINILEKLIEGDIEVVISTVTISEILTGAYLKKDFQKAINELKKVISQFSWKELDATIAQKTAQYLSYLITEGSIIEYQDAAIAATCTITGSTHLLTLNTEHFGRLPDIKNKVIDPKALKKIL